MNASTWALQDAKARFSELARRAMNEGPQHVTLRGEPALVVMSEAQYQRLKGKRKKRTWADLFRNSPFTPVELDLTRSRDAGRTLEF
jgi:antitoxin Phd